MLQKLSENRIFRPHLQVFLLIAPSPSWSRACGVGKP